MRIPKRRGTPIDETRMHEWTTRFEGFRRRIEEGDISKWLAQFQRGDRDVAACILDSVFFVNNADIDQAFVRLLNGLRGWSKSKTRRRGKWRFSPFSFSSGESGDRMISAFRIANGMDSKKYDELFIYKSELVREELGSNDSVVLVDDFTGTGDQAVTAWNEVFQELLPTVKNIYLILVAASEHAKKRIGETTGLIPMSRYTLTGKDDLFSVRCVIYSSDEKNVLLRYCRMADPNRPRGYGECGLLLVFSHKCPNNSLPILYRNAPRWKGLFASI